MSTISFDGRVLYQGTTSECNACKQVINCLIGDRCITDRPIEINHTAVLMRRDKVVEKGELADVSQSYAILANVLEPEELDQFEILESEDNIPRYTVEELEEAVAFIYEDDPEGDGYNFERTLGTLHMILGAAK